MVDPTEREATLGRIRELNLPLPETSARPRDELAGIAEDADAEVAPARLLAAARTAARPGAG